MWFECVNEHKWPIVALKKKERKKGIFKRAKGQEKRSMKK